MPLKIVKRYTRDDLQSNPDDIYVFGDNFWGTGYGGQAGAARREPNGFGIPTKWSPMYTEKFDHNTYFSDDDPRMYGINMLISERLRHLNDKLCDGVTVVWPEDGIGTGLSRWPEFCPKLLKFVEEIVDTMKKLHGVTEEKGE